MRRDLTIRVTVAIVTALVVLVALFHVALFAYVQIRFGTQWALLTLMVLFAWDAVVLIRLLHAVGDVYVGKGGGDE